MKKRNLILITAQFPYGTESEIFLENELPFLSSYFEKVIILPRKISPGLSNRKIPQNCKVLTRISNYPNKFLFNFEISVLIQSLLQFFCQIFSRNFWNFLTSYSYYFAKVPTEVKGAKEIELVIKDENLGKPIVYNYWSNGNILSVSILRKNKSYRKLYLGATVMTCMMIFGKSGIFLFATK